MSYWEEDSYVYMQTPYVYLPSAKISNSFREIPPSLSTSNFSKACTILSCANPLSEKIWKNSSLEISPDPSVSKDESQNSRRLRGSKRVNEN